MVIRTYPTLFNNSHKTQVISINIQMTSLGQRPCLDNPFKTNKQKRQDKKTNNPLMYMGAFKRWIIII